ncbi:MAG: hypothetical protein NTW21_21930 [Verrucomicrobia bacterium]|nr:hypothetical protein [Verrucomicrobiota bacterium]
MLALFFNNQGRPGLGPPTFPPAWAARWCGTWQAQEKRSTLAYSWAVAAAGQSGRGEAATPYRGLVRAWGLHGLAGVVSSAGSGVSGP